jgi:hypothetical protein
MNNTIPAFKPLSRGEFPDAPEWADRYMGPVNRQLDIITKSLQGRLLPANTSGGPLKKIGVRHGRKVRVQIDGMRIRPSGVTIVATPYPAFAPVVEPVDVGTLDLTVYFGTPVPSQEVPVVIQVHGDPSGVQTEKTSDLPTPSEDQGGGGGGGLTIHDLVGAFHAASGLTAGQVVRATGATTFAWQSIQDGDLPASIARDTEVAAAIAAHEAASDPHPTYTTAAELASALAAYQLLSEKDQASGYASLDGSTLVPVAELGSGSPSSATFLDGSRTWRALTNADIPSGDISYFRQVGTSPFECWYPAGVLPSATFGGTGAPGVDTLFTLPYWTGRGGTIDRIGIEWTSGQATRRCRVGIYASTSDTNLYPDALLVDSGEFDAVTTLGVKTATISTPLPPNQIVWFVYLAKTGGAAQGPTVRLNGSTGQPASPFGWPSTFGASVGRFWMTTAFTYAALPDPYPAGGVLNTAAYAANVYPIIMVRYSG